MWQDNYLLLDSDGIPEMYGELPDVDEGILVGQLYVHGQHLHKGALHEVYHREGRRRRELAVSHVCHVHLLQ